jgi:hypothetical protein
MTSCMVLKANFLVYKFPPNIVKIYSFSTINSEINCIQQSSSCHTRSIQYTGNTYVRIIVIMTF